MLDLIHLMPSDEQLMRSRLWNVLNQLPIIGYKSTVGETLDDSVYTDSIEKFEMNAFCYTPVTIDQLSTWPMLKYTLKFHFYNCFSKNS